MSKLPNTTCCTLLLGSEGGGRRMCSGDRVKGGCRAMGKGVYNLSPADWQMALLLQLSLQWLSNLGIGSRIQFLWYRDALDFTSPAPKRGRERQDFDISTNKIIIVSLEMTFYILQYRHQYLHNLAARRRHVAQIRIG